MGKHGISRSRRTRLTLTDLRNFATFTLGLYFTVALLSSTPMIHFS